MAFPQHNPLKKKKKKRFVYLTACSFGVPNSMLIVCEVDCLFDLAFFIHQRRSLVCSFCHPMLYLKIPTRWTYRTVSYREMTLSRD